ncbi:MAG: hypothetical protein FWD69_17040 [Polyangiaceae bacterium]|nr:hypothetical protein [Polyangiaceae bacterium]
MSLIFAGLIVVGAGGMAAWAARLVMRRAPPRHENDAEVTDRGGAITESTRLEGFPCQLGDVVMRITGEEAWLAGGVVLSEEAPVAALFVAPDRGRDITLFVRPAPTEVLFWLEPIDASIFVGGEPPTSIEHEGTRFERVRRWPLASRRIGVGAPDTGDSLILAEYTSAGIERLVVVTGSRGASFAYHGVELSPSSYEVIALGRATGGLDVGEIDGVDGS